MRLAPVRSTTFDVRSTESRSPESGAARGSRGHARGATTVDGPCARAGDDETKQDADEHDEIFGAVPAARIEHPVQEESPSRLILPDLEAKECGDEDRRRPNAEADGQTDAADQLDEGAAARRPQNPESRPSRRNVPPYVESPPGPKPGPANAPKSSWAPCATKTDASVSRRTRSPSAAMAEIVPPTTRSVEGKRALLAHQK